MLDPTTEIRDTTIGFHEEVRVEGKRAAKKTDQLPKNREPSVGEKVCGVRADYGVCNIPISWFVENLYAH
jgi:hypothetical protein